MIAQFSINKALSIEVSQQLFVGELLNEHLEIRTISLRLISTINHLSKVAFQIDYLCAYDVFQSCTQSMEPGGNEGI